MSFQALDLTGRRFGRLVALEREPKRCRDAVWRCLCDCGNTIAVTASHLNKGLTQSCWCLRREKASERSLVHGESFTTGNTAEHRAWTNMKTRCFNPNIPGFADYGGRGITVCDEWRDDYEAFLRDMGRRPSPHHSINRIDNDGNYEPGNCEWTTRSEQAFNRRAKRPQLMCLNGHPLDGPDVYVNAKGHRYCRICKRMRSLSRQVSA